MTTPKREPAELTVNLEAYACVNKDGEVYLASAPTLKVLGARPGDRLRIETAPGKLTLTLESKEGDTP